MEKLELKHLAPYLPYGLKFQLFGIIDDFECEDYFDEEKFKDGSIWSFGGYAEKDLYIPIGEGEIDHIFRNGSTYISVSLNRAKPILRPLSDLTKEIEINGERFVLIVELAKICDESFHCNKSVKTKEKIYGCKYMDNDGIINVLAYHEDIMAFGLHSEDGLSKQFHVAPNQYELFQKLFKWHFDVFGLIENGLAVNINRLL